MEESNIITTKLELNIIDYYCTFEYLLGYVGVEFPSTTMTCYCPFHENTNTKAAKLFVEDHNEHVFCFAENKQFRPHHLLTYGIVPFSVNHVFSSIWQNLSDEEKNIFSEDLRHYDVGIDLSKPFNDFKKCKITYFDLLNILRNS